VRVRILAWTRDLCYHYANRHDKRRWDLDVQIDAIDRQIEALQERRNELELRLQRERFRCYQLREMARAS